MAHIVVVDRFKGNTDGCFNMSMYNLPVEVSLVNLIIIHYLSSRELIWNPFSQSFDVQESYIWDLLQDKETGQYYHFPATKLKCKNAKFKPQERYLYIID